MRKPKRVKRNMKTINLTPKWADVMPWMIRVLESKSASESAKKPLRSELMRLAKFADGINSKAKGK